MHVHVHVTCGACKVTKRVAADGREQRTAAVCSRNDQVESHLVSEGWRWGWAEVGWAEGWVRVRVDGGV